MSNDGYSGTDKNILIIGGLGSSLIRFRGDLITSWLEAGHRVVAAAADGDVTDEFKERGVKFHKIPLRRTALNPIFDLRLLYSLIGLIKKEKPNTIYLYTIKPVIYGSLAAFLFKKIRVFSMITGLGYVFSDLFRKRTVRKLIVYLYRIALQRNEKVFFQNPDDIETFIELKIIISEKVVMVNGSGVNLDYYKPEPLPQSEVSFLLIARLLYEKGIIEYVEAARLIKGKYKDAIFRLVGWSLDDNRLVVDSSTVEKWRQEGIVEIYSETEDIRPHMKEASVYVLPSYREGTPRTVLEAMAMGRPIITTDTPGCRETVVEGVNGFLVPVKDAKALAVAMECFIAEPALTVRMGNESRRIAEDKYDVHKVNRVINETMGLS